MSLPNHYPVNTAVRFSAQFYNVSGQLADPTSIVFSTAGPDGITYSYNAVRDGTGKFHYDFTTSTPYGKWYYRFQGLGALIIQSEDTAYIIDSTRF